MQRRRFRGANTLQMSRVCTACLCTAPSWQKRTLRACVPSACSIQPRYARHLHMEALALQGMLYVASDAVAPAAAVMDPTCRSITLVAGTGSVVVGHDGSHGVRVGGWGALFADHASAFEIARQALACAAGAADRGKDCALQGTLQARAGVQSMPALLQWVYADPAPGHIATLAPAVLHAASADDADALSIRGEAAAAASELVAAAYARLQGADSAAAPSYSVVMSGGLFEDDGFRGAVETRVRERLPGAAVLRYVVCSILGCKAALRAMACLPFCRVDNTSARRIQRRCHIGGQRTTSHAAQSTSHFVQLICNRVPILRAERQQTWRSARRDWPGTTCNRGTRAHVARCFGASCSGAGRSVMRNGQELTHASCMRECIDAQCSERPVMEPSQP